MKKQPKIFAVAQTDARQAAAARALRREGFLVLGIEEIARADCILLPLPLDDEHTELTALLKAAKPTALAFGGKISPRAAASAKSTGIELIDYFAREELALLNAIPTAEGCIALLLEHRESTLFGAEILVIGFGRVAQALALRLCALGAKVSIAARSAEGRALACSMGCTTLDTATLAQSVSAFSCVVNTAPAMVLPQDCLEKLPEHSLIIDLASRPGGVDFACAKALGHHTIHALSLPAAAAPESAGAFVATTVLEILAERRN